MPAPGFFERQTIAKRNTTLLVFLFTLAVAMIALAVCIVGYLVTRSETTGLPFHHWLLSSHGLITAGAVILLIVGTSGIRWIDLAGGGERVARMVNARLLDPSSQDPDERRFRNIVEEMAIASGVPVPQLYVMDNETAINAFVAGYTPNEAVMVVTHGALNQLTRDELQGVVGHEFSHILNGDMRINVRLIALLAGILAIGQIGFFLLHSSSHRHSFSSGGRNNGRGVLLIVGLALAAIGYLGVFCGRLIQAAVSRERERLADASSVQFTRNPEGIGGALYKIGLKSGYLEHTSHASDMNHMCFGESTKMAFSRLLGSHPPVDERIEAIQPGLLTRLRSRMRDLPADQVTAAGTRAPGQTSGFAGSTGFSQQEETSIAATTGTVTQAGELYASKLLNRLPANVRELLYTRSGAVQLIYALLIHDLREDTAGNLLKYTPEAMVLRPDPALIRRFQPTLEREGDSIRLPALELAMPALRKLDPDERQALIRQVATMAEADGRITLFEFALHGFLQRHLASDSSRAVPVRYRSYRNVIGDLNTLFSLMARAGTRNQAEANTLHRQAVASFADRQGADNLALVEKVTVSSLRDSLGRLNQLSPMLKPAILDACAQCVRHDGRIAPREYELLRIVADQLDCPLPPLS
ncbi:M48 family metallopeptidase [Marinobacter sp. LN3S78]|uniref:M48 family metallopeptidase n=1 Tax=Marinobacter sp. LN3S78 TaxID=3382300 RepID=UPI00387B3077